MDNSNNFEQSVRNFLEKGKLPEGEELQKIYKGRDQLLAILAEQKANLSQEQVSSQSEANNIQELAQAGALMAASDNQTSSNSASSPKVTKTTKKTTNKTSNSSQNSQKVVVNNNTTNNVTNNTSTTTNTGNSNSNSGNNTGLSKVKSWLDGVFARQKEMLAQRDKAFKKRDWSLSRSSSKMMKRLDEMSRTFSERLDPRRVGKTFSNQLKTLLLMLGFQYLSKNWNKIIKIAENIEGFFTEGKLKKFLGGSKNEPFSTVLGNLFESAINSLWKKMENAWADRASAIKAVKFPTESIKGGDPISILKGLGTYLRDILSCMVSGKEGLKSGVVRDLESSARTSASKDNDAKAPKKEWTDNYKKNIAWGDATAEITNSPQMSKSDYDNKGNLANIGSQVKNSEQINHYLNKKDSVNPVAVMGGMNELSKSANQKGSVVIDPELLKSLSSTFKIDTKDLGKNIEVKYVPTQKTQNDFYAEHGNPLENALGTWLTRYGIQLGKKGLADGVEKLPIVGGPIGKGVTNIGTYLFDFFKTGSLVQDKNFRGYQAYDETKSNIENSSQYKLSMVRADDPKYLNQPGERIPTSFGLVGVGKDLQSNFSKTELSNEEVKILMQRLADSVGMSGFSFNNFEDIEKFERYLKKKALNNKLDEDPDNIDRYEKIMAKLDKSSDLNSEMFSTYETLGVDEANRDRELNNEIDNSQFGKFRDNVGNTVDNAVEWGSEMFNKAAGLLKPGNDGKYYTVDELSNSKIAKENGIDNSIQSDEIRENLSALISNILDPAAASIGEKIQVTSGYRNSEVNKLVGGSSTSDHLTGEAVDITTGSKEGNKKLYEILKKNGDFHKLINEDDFTWLHVSYKRDGKNIGKIFEADTKKGDMIAVNAIEPEVVDDINYRTTTAPIDNYSVVADNSFSVSTNLNNTANKVQEGISSSDTLTALLEISKNTKETNKGVITLSASIMEVLKVSLGKPSVVSQSDLSKNKAVKTRASSFTSFPQNNSNTNG